jgi:hypothetical protein
MYTSRDSSAQGCLTQGGSATFPVPNAVDTFFATVQSSSGTGDCLPFPTRRFTDSAGFPFSERPMDSSVLRGSVTFTATASFTRSEYLGDSLEFPPSSEFNEMITFTGLHAFTETMTFTKSSDFASRTPFRTPSAPKETPAFSLAPASTAIAAGDSPLPTLVTGSYSLSQVAFSTITVSFSAVFVSEEVTVSTVREFRTHTYIEGVAGFHDVTEVLIWTTLGVTASYEGIGVTYDSFSATWVIVGFSDEPQPQPTMGIAVIAGITGGAILVVALVVLTVFLVKRAKGSGVSDNSADLGHELGDVA